MATPKETLVKTPKSSVVFHETDGEGHVVGLGPMKVMICHEADFWFAQGLEIDYAANGQSLEEVKSNFEKGLTATIDLHIKAYGNLKHFMKAAPQDVWDELHAVGKQHTFTSVTFHRDLKTTLGYDGIHYIESGEAIAA